MDIPGIYLVLVEDEQGGGISIHPTRSVEHGCRCYPQREEHVQGRGGQLHPRGAQSQHRSANSHRRWVL